MLTTAPIMASTPATTSKPFPGEDEPFHFEPSISRLTINGEGDIGTLASTTTADRPNDLKVPSRNKNLSWKRVKSTLSRSQSQIFDLFSRNRGSTTKHKLGHGKLSTLDTIASGEPKLISAYKKPSTPIKGENEIETNMEKSKLFISSDDVADTALITLNNRNKTYTCNQPTNHQLHTIPRQSRTKLLEEKSLYANVFNPTASHHSRTQLNPTLSLSAGGKLTTQRLPPKGSQEENVLLSKQEYDVLINLNKRLQEENQEVWDDNKILTLTFEDAQTRLKYFEERNKYLEIAMFQEGKVLTEIIRECHDEIARLKASQCELLQNKDDLDNDRKIEKRIREYYISKYANRDESLFSQYSEHPVSGLTTFLDNLPEGMAE